ncbi:MAG: PQQ-binding-like beta-propeller repeat protein [Acidobacteria bacterium]|nr:PQQ-binding-like beta-propeller repeat protein [Acidobacteriota bacterium]
MKRRPVRLRLIAAATVAAVLASQAASAASDNWPQFRGPDGTAVIADDPALPESWSATENVAWRTPIPGLGWSSPIVWGDRVFVTTVVADEDYEGPRTGLYLPAGGADTPPDPPPGTHHWLLLCFDLGSGELLWQRTAHSGPMTATIHPKNSFASATPVTDGERVYALFGNLGLFAYDLDGRLVWSRDIESLPDQWGWGAGSSPALLDDQVLVMHDNDEDSYLASFDAATGEQNWRTPRDEVSAWSTPFVWRNDLRTEIVTVARTQVRSYDPAGNLLWWFSGDMTSATVPTPVPGDGIIYVSSGHVGHDHRPVYAVLPGAVGDITLRPRQRANEYIRWYDPRGASYNPSPLLYRGIYYTLLDRGFLTAHDARTGRTVYDRVRIEPGATFTSSPWAYNGKIFALSEDGDTYVIAAGPDYELLGKNVIGEMTLASTAVAGRTLLLRTASNLYAIRR